MEGEFNADRYLARRRLTEAGVGEIQPGPAMCEGDRAERLREAARIVGLRDLNAPPSARTAIQPSRGGSLPRPAGRRVETNSGRPGTLTRGPGLAPPAMVRAIQDEGGDVRVCGHPTCKTINTNIEGPADGFCSAHR